MKKNLRGLIIVLALVVLNLVVVQEVNAQKIEGTDFWWVMPSNNTNLGGTANMVVQSNYYANVTVTFPLMTGSYSTQTATITPGTQTVILLGGPQEYVGNQVAGATSAQNIFPVNDAVKENVGVHIMADSSITVYCVNHESNSMDAETLLPTSMLGTSYVVASRSCSNYLSYPANFTVCATQNNTNITIKTWIDPGTDQTDVITLNAGQTWKRGITNTSRGTGVASQFHLVTGSTVTSNKPVVVVGHTPCSSMMDCGACDMMMTELLPTNLWGTKYVTAQPIKRTLNTCGSFSTTTSDYLEIIGTVGQRITITNSAGTSVKTIPVMPFPTSCTSYGFLWYDNPAIGGATNPETFGEANMVLTSAQPFAVVQYVKDLYTDNSPNTDPEACVVYPTSYWQSEYLMTTITPIGTGSPTAQVVLVTDNSLPGAQNITVDGVAVPGASWQSFAGGTYSFARFNLPSVTTTHKIVNRSGANFGFYITYGDGVESYVTQGGGTQIPVARMLPIELLSFNATPGRNRAVELNWATVTEKNAGLFVIERSSTGNDFTTIATTSAFGNSNTLKNYTIIDHKAQTGFNYYRLKQIDNNGKEYILAMNVAKVQPSLSIGTLAPNPAGNVVNMEVVADENTTIDYSIADITGRVLSTVKTIAIEAGVNTIPIALENFEAGVYFITTKQLNATEAMTQIKFVKD